MLNLIKNLKNKTWKKKKHIKYHKFLIENKKKFERFNPSTYYNIKLLRS